MRPQCKRIYSALPTQCERICEGRCVEACVGDASTEPREQRTDLGQGLNRSVSSPSPSFSVRQDVWQILDAALASISENDYGRPWPVPRRDVLAGLLASHDSDQCIQAARETREIVQSQDRAPNITALFAKKLAELSEIRSAVRDSLGVAS